MDREASNKKVLDEKERKVFVVSLPHDISTEDLKRYFARFGAIEDVRIIKDKEVGTLRGFGFILFQDRLGYIRVFEEGDFHVIRGKQVATSNKVECRKVLLRDELQNMQSKPANPQSPMDQGQLDGQAMNNMYLQFFQMQQQMYQPNQNWNMNNQDSDNLSIQENRSYKIGSYSSPKTNSFIYENAPEEYGQQESNFFYPTDNPNVWTPNRFSDGSHRQESMEDDWSTRPRAKNHLSKFDLRNLPNQEGGDKKSKVYGSGFEINIRNVVELLEDDDQIHYSGFSGQNQEVPNKKVRSVENSSLNSGFGTKQESGWSDTLGSKLNKTKTTRDSTSTPYQRSFGEPKTPQDLTTIFETKGGPFFAWDDKPQPAKREEYF